MARKPAKPQRRKPNTGSIRFKKGRALPYEAAFPIGHGEHRYDSFQSRQEAEAHLDRLAAERDSVEQPRNIAGGSQLVRAFFPLWLLSKVKVSPNTLSIYSYLLGLSSGEGDLGRYRLDEVTREAAGAMLAYFGRKDFKSVEQLRAVCRQAFEYALDEHYIKSNPFTKAEAPSVEHREAIGLTAEQRQHLLECAAIEDNSDVPLCPLWHLYSRIGFRRGEGIGIRWQDCDLRDLDRATITISGQLTREGSVTTPRKTTKSKDTRTVPIPRDIAEMLRELRQWQIRRASKHKIASLPDFVFTDTHGAPLKVGYIADRWHKLRTRAGMPADLRVHDLRHTAMYLLAVAGVPDTVRMKIAGHKTTAMSHLYASHVNVDDMRRAIR